MKKATIWLSSILLCALLAACGGMAVGETPDQSPASAVPPPAPTPVAPMESTPEDAPEAPQMSVLNEENAPARAAYAAALKKLLDTRILPDGTDDSRGYIGSIDEREKMAANQFSVFDVDGDGREELILLYTTTMIAGERGFVFDWDEASGDLRVQLDEFPLLTFYESGAVQAGWSHNQGKGGAFWPYNLYEYLPEDDVYRQVGAVDAWDKTVGTQDYPSEVDESNSGFVYYIYEDLAAQWDNIDPIDAAQYQAWLAPYVGDGAELPIPYVELTAEQIQALQTPG